MPKYDISPEGVKKVVTDTSTEAAKFETHLAPIGTGMEALATACGNSGAVVPALSGLFEFEGTRLQNMSTRINACITGAAEATNAYVRGDLDMVATYQTNASQAVISYPPPQK